jgi:hypothetical protein
MIRRALFLWALAGALWSQDLSDKNLEAVKKQILPDADDLRWDQIAWRATYWDGVVDAQKADKPILLWAMNGHALGCT